MGNAYTWYVSFTVQEVWKRCLILSLEKLERHSLSIQLKSQNLKNTLEISSHSASRKSDGALSSQCHLAIIWQESCCSCSDEVARQKNILKWQFSDKSSFCWSHRKFNIFAWRRWLQTQRGDEEDQLLLHAALRISFASKNFKLWYFFCSH